MGKLTPKQERFVAEYLIDLNATQAAIRAGYLIKTARQQGSRLLTNADIAQAVQNGRKEVTEQLEVDSRWVLQRWIEIATADPNDLIQYRRGGACADCWDAEDVGKVDPRPDCVKCHGEGRGSVFVHDTRNLKGGARKLYAGVQLGKDGIKVLMRDQDAALANIARHLGMFKDKVEHSGTVSIASLIEQSFGKPEGD
jgi:phage terminase small subunit